MTEADVSCQTRKVRQGVLKVLSYEQVDSLMNRLGDRPSKRRIYIKLACLAVLKYDADGRYLTAEQIAKTGSKYVPKNIGFSSQVVGTILGILCRMKIVNRSENRPHVYWWRDE